MEDEGEHPIRDKNGNIRYFPCVSWTHCRDKFQDVPNHSLMDHGMWFCHTQNQKHNVCDFIERIESRIDKKRPLTRSKFYETTYENILWVKMSPFWIYDFVRRSFFTLALRCGQKYRRSKNNFDQAMYGYKLSAETKPAIKRFLDGYTIYVGNEPDYNIEGWNYLFAEMSHKEVQELLIAD
jgi:hypothetical protein